jgi:hypothetical protein
MAKKTQRIYTCENPHETTEHGVKEIGNPAVRENGKTHMWWP